MVTDRRGGMRFAAGGLAFLIVAAFVVTAMSDQHPAEAAPTQNVVILLADDQRFNKVTAAYMPNVWHRLAAGGTTYPNAFVPDALCCPSRASILTGDYSHTHGVWSNRVEDGGGFPAFRPSEDSTMATDYSAAGYRTLLVGKYMNDYKPASMYVPPGWTKFFAVEGTTKYYDYSVNLNGKELLSYGSAPEDYIVRTEKDRAVQFVQNSGSRPFFLYWSFSAPHFPATPDPRDTTRFSGRTDSAQHDNMLEAAYSMDRAIGRLLDVLPPNTIVAYLSDNGYLWGERVAGRGGLSGKQWPYNGSIRIPMVLKALDGSVAFPAKLSLNVDLRETLGAAVGVPVPSTDGISLLSESRSVFHVEHMVNGTAPEILSYCGAREPGWLYVRYSDGVEEFFEEPNERANLAGNASYQIPFDRLKAAAQTLCSPTPPGYGW
jgi:N-acetylglucosamine-6-sulfatase